MCASRSPACSASHLQSLLRSAEPACSGRLAVGRRRPQPGPEPRQQLQRDGRVGRQHSQAAVQRCGAAGRAEGRQRVGADREHSVRGSCLVDPIDAHHIGRLRGEGLSAQARGESTATSERTRTEGKGRVACSPTCMLLSRACLLLRAASTAGGRGASLLPRRRPPALTLLPRAAASLGSGKPSAAKLLRLLVLCCSLPAALPDWQWDEYAPLPGTDGAADGPALWGPPPRPWATRALSGRSGPSPAALMAAAGEAGSILRWHSGVKIERPGPSS
jgi:hypothetical protein